jgi:hypothetical protein
LIGCVAICKEIHIAVEDHSIPIQVKVSMSDVSK